MMNWLVDVDESCSREYLRDPSIQFWLRQRERDGPPVIMGVSPNGLPVARGPSGESIEFTVVAKPLEFGTGPPYAIIGIRSISSP